MGTWNKCFGKAKTAGILLTTSSTRVDWFIKIYPVLIDTADIGFLFMQEVF